MNILRDTADYADARC